MASKVRIACRRCRIKRIKCDGGIPACSNCSKVNEPCIDVDGRNKALSIPRDFAANARARIEWLEAQMRRVAPEFDLKYGPPVDFAFLDNAGAGSSPMACDGNFSSESHVPDSASNTTKRTYSSVSEPTSQEGFADEARSVALDLGLLTLNSDSRQTHYLGTSSGRLFTSLIGAASPESRIHAGNNKSFAQPVFSSPGPSGPFAHAKRAKESCYALHQSLKKSLPPEEDAYNLLDVYFRNVHVDHPFLHPASLVRAVEALYQTVTDDASMEIGFNGWGPSVLPFSYNGEFHTSRNSRCTPISIFTATFHVFMVFTLAATIKTRQRIYDFAPNQFYRIAVSAGEHCFSNTSLASLQATLLLAVYSLLSPAELNIWTLTYVAMAHCIDLGLHRTPSPGSGLSQAALLTRRLLFFSVYHLDRSIAAIQGRPLGIRDETFDLELPSLEDVEADASNIPETVFASGIFISGALAYTLHRFELDPIVSEIKLLFYHLPSQVKAYAWPVDHHAAQIALQQKLTAWRHNLSAIKSSFCDSSDEDHVEYRKLELKLTSQYFAAMVLLYQPSQTIQHPSEPSLLICYQCAASRLTTYNDLYHAESFYQSWRSVQGIFSSGATMIYCLWTTTLVRDTIPLGDAMKDLRTASNLLSVGGEWWPSVKKGKESFARAIDALFRQLDASHHGNQDYSQDQRPPERRNRDPSQSVRVLADIAVPGVLSSKGMHNEAQDTSESLSQFPDIFPNFSTADWSRSGDPEYCQNPQPMLGVFQDQALGGTDSAVEAFIAQFLNNDTAWNAF
ncbi:fungal-specific transcription factor domain-containing protein [Paraphoma chrysanthemicola]|nr:fungal-specific transcription factor domain-containing protein [Paraphoma chrysanthemicola]